MTHPGREHWKISNDRNGILKKKLTSNQHLIHKENCENGRRHFNGQVDESELLNEDAVKGKTTKVSFNIPRGRDYPIMSWFVDSGASEHMVNSEEYFDDSRQLERPTRVVVAKSGVELQANRVGTVRGHAIVNGQRVEYTFTDVLFVPDLQANLFSVTKVVKLKLKVIFENSICTILKRDKEVAVAVRDDKLYELKILLHSMYCTPSITLRVPGNIPRDTRRTGKHPVVPDTSVTKSTGVAKRHTCHIDVRPRQKVYRQEL